MGKYRPGCEKYVRRMAFEITEEQQQKLNYYLSAHGTKKQVFQALTIGLLKLFDAGETDKVLGAVYKGILGPKEILGVESDVSTEIKEEDSTEALPDSSETLPTSCPGGVDVEGYLGADS